MIALTGARVVTPDALLDGSHVAVNGRRIAAIAPGAPPEGRARRTSPAA